MDLRAQTRRHPRAGLQAAAARCALWSRNRLSLTAAYPAVAEAIAALPVKTGHPRRRGHRRLGPAGQGRLPRLRRAVAERTQTSPRCRSTERRALLRTIPFRLPVARVEAAGRPRAVGARLRRRLGRRHRQAARLALRAPPLEALAEDEVRGHAGAGRSAASPIRRAAASGSARCWSATSKATTSCSPARSAPASTRRCFSSCARGSTRWRLPARRSRRATGLPRLRVHWVAPEVVVQVAFTEWTVHGKLRHPRLLGVRIDKAARAGDEGAAVTASAITHPEKVLFPDDGITKGELAAYYDAVAPVMLPHLRRRPITMERFPNGIGEKGFLQKDVVKGFPDVAEAGRGAEEGRHRALSAGQRPALAAVAGQPEHRHAARVAVARAASRPAGRLRVRPRSVARRARSAARGDAGHARACSTSSAMPAG